MRPIFPVQTVDSRMKGFTFIEVLVALCIAAVMVAVIGSSLITSLNAEQTATHLQSSTVLAQRLATTLFLGLSPDDVFSAEKADWDFLSKAQNTSDGTNPIAWQVWTLSPKVKPSLKTALAFQSIPGKKE